MAAKKIATIGECMMELSNPDTGALALGFGGDTLNTAVYLSRLGNPKTTSVDYLTALGDDPYSQNMLDGWAKEHVGTDKVVRLPGKLPGLYIIRTDAKGERKFYYYRSAAAARELFGSPTFDPMLAALADYDLIYFSSITLSILSTAAREKFFGGLEAARKAGAKIAFDTNYRPAGWPDRATAAETVTRFLHTVDIALPTFDDEQALFGDADVAGTIARIQAAGVAEVVVKQGPDGCVVAQGGKAERVAVPEPVTPIDTTAAGDSFNAGYLTGRLMGWAPAKAAVLGHRLAGIVVQHRGAIVPKAATDAIEMPA